MYLARPNVSRRQWVRDKCRESGLPDMEMRDVHLVSCKHGVGIAPLMRKVRPESDKIPIRVRWGLFCVAIARKVSLL